jgi:hypothetical protein
MRLGFARGLGREVIWACRKDELHLVHFGYQALRPRRLGDASRPAKEACGEHSSEHHSRVVARPSGRASRFQAIDDSQ